MISGYCLTFYLINENSSICHVTACIFSLTNQAHSSGTSRPIVSEWMYIMSNQSTSNLNIGDLHNLGLQLLSNDDHEDFISSQTCDEIEMNHTFSEIELKSNFTNWISTRPWA